MSSPTHRDAARDPHRESSGDESETDHALEEARRIALEAHQRFLDLQQRSQGKATPPVLPRRRQPPSSSRRHLIGSIALHHHHRRNRGAQRRLHQHPRHPLLQRPNPRRLPTPRRREIRNRSSPPQHPLRPKSGSRPRKWQEISSGTRSRSRATTT